MRTLIIDPSKNIDEFITETEIEDWRGITSAIGGPCQVFTAVSTELLEGHTAYVDDEGLYNGQLHGVGEFYVKDYPNPLAGRAVVRGFDHDTGEDTPCTLSVEEAQKIFGYPTRVGPLYRA